MNNNIKSDNYIYETPDGGLTVYRRPIGSNNNEKELIISKEPCLFTYAELQEIKELSKTNTSLKKALDHLMLIYYTIKDDKDSS